MIVVHTSTPVGPWGPGVKGTPVNQGIPKGLPLVRFRAYKKPALALTYSWYKKKDDTEIPPLAINSNLRWIFRYLRYYKLLSLCRVAVCKSRYL